MTGRLDQSTTRSPPGANCGWPLLQTPHWLRDQHLSRQHPRPSVSPCPPADCIRYESVLSTYSHSGTLTHQLETPFPDFCVCRRSPADWTGRPTGARPAGRGAAQPKKRGRGRRDSSTENALACTLCEEVGARIRADPQVQSASVSMSALVACPSTFDILSLAVATNLNQLSPAIINLHNATSQERARGEETLLATRQGAFPTNTAR